MPLRNHAGPSALVDAQAEPGDSRLGPLDTGLVASALSALDVALQTLAAAPALPSDAATPLGHAVAAARELRRLLYPAPPPPTDPIAASVEPLLVVGLLRLDTTARHVTLAEQPVHLTPTEYRIIHQLALTPGRTVTRERLLTQVWGPEYVEATDYLWVHLSRLRQKLCLPGQPPLIVTERGLGYRLRIARR